MLITETQLSITKFLLCIFVIEMIQLIPLRRSHSEQLGSDHSVHILSQQ